MSPDAVAFFNTTLVPIGLMLIMFSMGLTLALRDFGMVARHPVPVAAGFATHLLLLPLLGLSIGLIFMLPPELALGLFIISICPAGTTSNALTFVGRGNVALAVILTALTSLVTVFTIPLLLSWAVPHFLAGQGTVPSVSITTIIMQLVRITVLPMITGMIVRHFAPDFAARMAVWLRPTALIILIATIGVAVLSSLEMVLQRLVAATPAIIALNLSAMALGLLIGKLVAASPRDAMTLSIETGVQNVTLAYILTNGVFRDDPSVAVTQNIYGVLMLVNASLLIRWWRGRIVAAEAAA